MSIFAKMNDFSTEEMEAQLNKGRVAGSALALLNNDAGAMEHAGDSGLLIISDSTGITPSETEGWPYLVAEALATQYTNSAVMVRFWDAGNQVYNNWTNLNAENDRVYIDMSAPDGQARTRILSHELIGSFTDLDIRFDVELLDYTPASTSTIGGAWGSSGDRGHRVRINTDGSIGYQWTEDGSTEETTNSTTSAGLTDGERYQVRVVHDVDNGAGGNDVSFYYRQIGVDAWTQIGTTVTNSGTTSIAQPARNYEIGGALGQFVTEGKYFGVEARDGEDGANIMPQPITLFGGAEDLSPLAGSPTIFVTIGAQSGGAINRSDNPTNSFVDATRLPKMVEKWYSSLSVILSTGHNEDNENLDLKTDLDGWLSDMQGILPFADYAILTQNPRLNESTERHRRQIGQILGWGKRNGLSVIDTYRAYLKDPRGVAALVQVDEVHPNADGAIVEASAIIDCLS